jgi:ACT domain-containing protein
MQEFFVMTMMVDLAGASVPFDVLQARLVAKGAELGLRVDAQHEDVFKFMHRI